MLKVLIVIAATIICCPVAMADPDKTDQTGQSNQTTQTGRSWEECNKIAVERGLRHPKNAERYQTRLGFGEPMTKPQGLIARCMAGQPI
ncbi:MAG TPA: hypothetical protein VMH84_04165 [Xanthobacteraceae bacterium]|nr:hypothetical protein [Xanthobacteraceae bacterium]